MIRQPRGRLGVLVLLMGNDSGPPRLKPVAKRDRGVGALIRLIVRSPNRDTHLHRYYRDSEIMISRGTNADGRGTSTGFSTSKRILRILQIMLSTSRPPSLYPKICIKESTAVVLVQDFGSRR